MALKTSREGAVSAALALVLMLVVGGIAVAGTAAYFVVHPEKVTSPGATTGTTPSNNSTTPTPAKGTPAPLDVNVTDDLGRKVEVPIDAKRVVVLGPQIMDMMYRLGLRSHVVGVDCYAQADGGISEDYSPDQVSLWGLSNSMCVQVGPEFAPETLANLTPDLVLAATFISIADVQQITTSLGIPVVMVQAPTMSGILVDDSLIGTMFNVSTAATTLNAQLSSALYNVTNETSSIYTNPTVLLTYDTDSNGYWTFGPGSFGLSLVELAGGTSISGNSTSAYPELSPAQVIWDDPQFIVYGTGYGLNESTYAAGPDWGDFGAVTSGNTSGIDSNWITEPDPTMILVGLPALFEILHPDGA